MSIYVSLVRLRIHAPDLIQKFEPGEDLVGVAEEFIEKVKFLGRQLDLLPSRGHRQSVIVQHASAKGQFLLIFQP